MRYRSDEADPRGLPLHVPGYTEEQLEELEEEDRMEEWFAERRAIKFRLLADPFWRPVYEDITR
jgi:hypothetical protein